MTINTMPDIHNLIICANMFVRKNGKHILLKRSLKKKYAPGYIHPIGGKVDLNEDPFVAAQRELMEEAGITVNNVKLEAVILEIKPTSENNQNWLIFHFSGDYESGVIRPTEEGEFIELTTEEVKVQNLFPSVKVLIDKILNPNDGTVFLTARYDEDGNFIETSPLMNVCKV